MLRFFFVLLIFLKGPDLDATPPPPSSTDAFEGFYEKCDCKSGREVEPPTVCLLSTYKTVKLSDNASLHLNIDAHHRRAWTHTNTGPLVSQPPCLTGKGNGFFSIWRATNKRCCQLILDSSLFKEPLRLWIWRWGFGKARGKKGKFEGGKRSESEKSWRFCVPLVLSLLPRALAWIYVLDLAEWLCGTNEKVYVDTEPKATGQRVITDMDLVMGQRNTSTHKPEANQQLSTHPVPLSCIPHYLLHSVEHISNHTLTHKAHTPMNQLSAPLCLPLSHPSVHLPPSFSTEPLSVAP